MDIEQAIFTELSSVLNGKIYPIQAQQDISSPYITYRLTSHERNRIMTGHDNLVDAEYSIDIFYDNYSSLKTLTASVVNEIKTWRFTTLGTTGPHCQRCDITEEVYTHDFDTNLYQCTLDILITYREE
jgi:hypothetical protein